MKKCLLLLAGLIFMTLVSCEKQPTASFTFLPTNVTVGTVVTFINTSTDGDSYSWDFGDGSQSTIMSPNHTYTSAGAFSVSLEVFSKNGKKKDVASASIVVQGATVPPVANYTYNPATVRVGIDVAFTDQSLNLPSSWQWDFGDGGTSILQHPHHTFASTGSYSVSLTAINSFGSDQISQNINVTNAAASFAGSYDVSVVCPGFNYDYTDVITPSTTVNNRLTVTKFAGFVNAVVYFDVNGSNITVPSQTFSCDSPPVNHTFSGSGTISGTTLTISYSDIAIGTTTYCTDTYTKQ